MVHFPWFFCVHLIIAWILLVARSMRLICRRGRTAHCLYGASLLFLLPRTFFVAVPTRLELLHFVKFRAQIGKFLLQSLVILWRCHHWRVQARLIAELPGIILCVISLRLVKNEFLACIVNAIPCQMWLHLWTPMNFVCLSLSERELADIWCEWCLLRYAASRQWRPLLRYVTSWSQFRFQIDHFYTMIASLTNSQKLIFNLHWLIFLFYELYTTNF